ncbi:MAG: DUF1800 domain-containing protein [Piscinibacter sp.]|nr:DUF1800 domain-containing protein [Piscinibacter sp.]
MTTTTEARWRPAAIAAHRFGLGEPRLDTIATDPQGWLLGQIGPAERARGDGLLDAAAALERLRGPAAMRIEATREVVQADQLSRQATALASERPFAERLARFWANHFTVSLGKGAVRGLVGAFEREAIRPHIAGTFEQLLWASTTHPGMLRYLDNQFSAGPHSRIVGRAARRAARMGEEPRVTGLNENLAREVLELHTLGVDGGYSQADVTAFAAVLTGWRADPRQPGRMPPFEPDWHEPGDKQVLGRRYREGPEALRQVLSDLARHPSTARFLATKLARHFVADDPPPELVERLVARYRATDGQLSELYRTLVQSPEPWASGPAKLKSPEDYVISSARLLEIGQPDTDAGPLPRLLAQGSALLGQRPQAAPSPAGWPDRAEDWLGPESLWKRVEWATRVGDRLGRRVDARALAATSLGPWLGATARQQIERAADGPQALALLLLAPEFQRR